MDFHKCFYCLASFTSPIYILFDCLYRKRSAFYYRFFFCSVTNIHSTIDSNRWNWSELTINWMVFSRSCCLLATINRLFNACITYLILFPFSSTWPNRCSASKAWTDFHQICPKLRLIDIDIAEQKKKKTVKQANLSGITCGWLLNSFSINMQHFNLLCRKNTNCTIWRRCASILAYIV